MKVNQSCTHAAMVKDGVSNTEKQIDIFNIFEEQFIKQFTVKVDETITGTYYDRFDFLPSSIGNNLVVLTDSSLLIYSIPFKRDNQITSLQNPKAIELPEIFEEKLIPHFLKFSQYNPELYFGYILKNYVIINFLDLSTVNPKILEIRKYQCPDSNFIWFDFSSNNSIYLLSEMYLWRMNLFDQSNEIKPNERVFSTSLIESSTKHLFKSAAISPAYSSTVALMAISPNKRILVCICSLSPKGVKLKTKEIEGETNPLLIQWSSYGSTLFVNGNDRYILSNIFGENIILSKI